MDDSSISLREFLEARLDRQDAMLADITANVKKTNGRVNGHDVKIAILMVAYGAGAFMTGAWYLGWIK